MAHIRQSRLGSGLGIQVKILKIVQVFSSEAGLYLRLTDSFITQLKPQRPSRTCNESKEEDKKSSLASGREITMRASPGMTPALSAPASPA